MPLTLWDYRSCLIDTRGFWAGRGKVDPAEFDGTLARYGGEGWELVAVVPLSDGNVGTARLLLTFKRPRAVQ